MAGLFDYHVCASLQKQIPAFLADRDAFLAVCMAIEAEEAGAWFDLIVADPPEIILWGQKPAKDLPIIIVHTPSEMPEGEYQPMSNDAGKADDGRQRYMEMTRESLQIEVLARDPHVTVALSILVRCSLLMSVPLFVKVAGYETFGFDGVDPLSEAQEYAAEAMEVTVRLLRYSAISALRVTALDAAAAPKSWFVLNRDQTLDGVPGGVAPYTPGEGG
uniref:Uncharacterized protein n=1 Tax=uncultured Caudovirales phage TaxID=2100421 RepID=A0A6J5LA05_9CAUD|nr:hypothetical protein UFOVP114_52 [uncultured Caudovirales phage]